jgi:hypothetical protein
VDFITTDALQEHMVPLFVQDEQISFNAEQFRGYDQKPLE